MGGGPAGAEAAEGQPREICNRLAGLAGPGGGRGTACGDLSVNGWRALAAAEGQPGEICGSHYVTKISY